MLPIVQQYFRPHYGGQKGRFHINFRQSIHSVQSIDCVSHNEVLPTGDYNEI